MTNGQFGATDVRWLFHARRIGALDVKALDVVHAHLPQRCHGFGVFDALRNDFDTLFMRLVDDRTHLVLTGARLRNGVREGGV